MALPERPTERLLDEVALLLRLRLFGDGSALKRGPDGIVNVVLERELRRSTHARYASRAPLACLHQGLSLFLHQPDHLFRPTHLGIVALQPFEHERL